MLLRRVRPEDWSNPRPREIYDLVVVGAGPAGIEAAQYARRLSLSVALVERNQTQGRLSFTTDVGSAIASAEVVFIGKDFILERQKDTR